ncbi:hypothetical protein D3C76_1572950 [compost metagenome]
MQALCIRIYVIPADEIGPVLILIESVSRLRGTDEQSGAARILHPLQIRLNEIIGPTGLAGQRFGR